MENFEFDEQNDDSVQLPPEVTEGIMGMIQPLLPEGATAEVTPMLLDEKGMYEFIVESISPLMLISAVVDQAGRAALHHVLHDDDCDGDHSPERVFDLSFEVLSREIARVQEVLRPLYLDMVEREQFSMAVGADLESLETIGDAELAKLIESYSHEQEEEE